VYTNRDRYFLTTAFFLTGATGLAFQVIWTRLLVLSFGYTIFSVSTVVATFMGGLALGSLIGGKLSDRLQRLALLYATLEILVGLLAVAVTFILLRFPEIIAVIRQQLAIPYHGFSIWIVLGSLVLLLPPTVLMGTTLPILAKAVTRGPDSGGRDISPLYALNTLGAALGSLLTGFVMLALFGVTGTVLGAAAMNMLVGLAVWLRFRNTAPPQATPRSTGNALRPMHRFEPIAVAFGISGFASLAAEVAWTRILAPFLESSVYAFTIVLSLFLIGIALGTLVGRGLTNRTDPETGFGLAQIGVGFFTTAGLFLLYPFIGTHSAILSDLGAIVQNPSLLLANIPWFALILLPSTFFMGLGFPFIAQWAAQQMLNLGQRTGRIYAINTVAAVAGSVLAGFTLIPLLGVKNTLLLTALMSMLTGFWLFLRGAGNIPQKGPSAVLGLLLLATLVFGLRMDEPSLFATKLAYPGNEILHHVEDPDASVTLLQTSSENRQLNISLRPVSGTSRVLTPWMTHLPLLLSKELKNQRVLNIGLGIGHTFETALAYPGSQVTTVELVPAVFETFRHHRPDARDLLARKNGEIILGDGRSYLLDTPDASLDAIIVDPTPPLYGAGAVNLYTENFFEICRRKLRSNGRLMMRLPYSADSFSVRLVIRAALEVFPHASLWQALKGSGYSLIVSPSNVSLPTAETLSQRLQELKFISSDERGFLQQVQPRPVARRGELADWVSSLPLVTDDHPFLEHPLFFDYWKATVETSSTPSGMPEG
jgi:spermidine synthase